MRQTPTAGASEPLERTPAARSPVPILTSWILVFLASLTLYAMTASRGAQWQDSGEFILRITTGDLTGIRGLALAHPLHYWLGRLAIAPRGLSPATAITLVSSVAAAVAVANVFGATHRLTASTSAALFAAVSLAVANTFWHLATISEVYTLGAALLAGECWCLFAYAENGRHRAVWGMCLLNGLGLANHLQAILTLPVVAAVCIHALWRRRIGITGLLAAAGLWITGSLPYTILVVQELHRSGDLAATLRSALFGTAYAANVLNAGSSARMLLTIVCFPLLNFPNLLLPAAFYGIARAARTGGPAAARRGLLAALLLHAAFALRYNVIDQHTFFLPMYVLLAIFGGVGAASVRTWPPSTFRRALRGLAALLLVLTPVTYVAATAIARHQRLLGRFAHHKPYRDDYTYLLIPWTFVDRSAEQMSSQALHLAGADGLIIVEDSMAEPAIRYKRNVSGLHDVTIIIARSMNRPESMDQMQEGIGAAAGAGRAIVLVPLDRDHPRVSPADGRWRRVGDLYLWASGSSRPTSNPSTEQTAR